MKTKFLKLVLPTFILLLAIGSAYAFKNVEKQELLAPEVGWISLAGEPCSLPVQCSTTPSEFMCTAVHNGANYQAFGKNNPNLLVCIKILFRF